MEGSGKVLAQKNVKSSSRNSKVWEIAGRLLVNTKKEC